jgi:multidrug efflux system membrane fusion protein
VLTRAQNLAKSGLGSRADLDAATAAAAAIQATINADAAAVETARIQVERTRITSPVPGRTGALLVHRGALIRANDTAPLVVINQMDSVFVSFAVPARLLPQLQRARSTGGLPVEIAPAGGGDRATGRVTFIDNAVDLSTDTIRLKATVRNETRRLWPGAFVDVSLQLSVQPQALVVPASAVQQSQQGTFVYVVKSDQTVEMRPVKVAWSEGRDSVIESGVRPGETVVTDGQLRLTPGARITARAADDPEK